MGSFQQEGTLRRSLRKPSNAGGALLKRRELMVVGSTEEDSNEDSDWSQEDGVVRRPSSD